MTYANSFEALSLLKDGELSAADAATLMQALDTDAQLRAAWHRYHLIGEALQENDAASLGTVRVGRVDAVHADMQTTQLPQADASHASLHPLPNAANESVFRWKMVAGVASVAAVGALIWSLVGGGSSAQLQPQWARNSAPAVSPSAQPANAATDNATQSTTVLAQREATAQTTAVAASGASGGTDVPQVMIRDPRLDELLAAHKQFGNASALQQPAGFLRNATFQTPQR